jgi:ABC-2 type transport system permease protein
MSTLSYTMADSATMLRRNLRRMLRYPTLVIFAIAIPVVLMLLFVYVFGGTLGDGLDGTAGGRREYANYLAPGILVLTVAGAGQGVAISIAMDMTEGIVARFKTMSISRVAVLTGHVIGNMLQTALAIAVVIPVALLVGFRPDASALEWLAAIGLLALVTLALTWLCVAAGLWAKTVETASNIPMPLLILPFFGSGFAPTEQMPAAVRWFADHQPFTPMNETLRGLLTGTGIGNDGIVSVAWCVAITAFGYLAARRLYDRDPAATT